MLLVRHALLRAMPRGSSAARAQLLQQWPRRWSALAARAALSTSGRKAAAAAAAAAQRVEYGFDENGRFAALAAAAVLAALTGGVAGGVALSARGGRGHVATAETDGPRMSDYASALASSYTSLRAMFDSAANDRTGGEKYLKSSDFMNVLLRGRFIGVDDERVEEVCNAYDNDVIGNDSGEISFAEFCVLTCLVTTPLEHIDVAFNVVDQDGSGCISAKEFSSFTGELVRLNGEVAEAWPWNRSRLMKHLFDDGSGDFKQEITEGQFLQFVRKLKQDVVTREFLLYSKQEDSSAASQGAAAAASTSSASSTSSTTTTTSSSGSWSWFGGGGGGGGGGSKNKNKKGTAGSAASSSAKTTAPQQPDMVSEAPFIDEAPDAEADQYVALHDGARMLISICSPAMVSECLPRVHAIQEKGERYRVSLGEIKKLTYILNDRSEDFVFAISTYARANDGVVRPADFQRAAQVAGGVNLDKPTVKMVLDLFDKDGSGTLDVDELELAISLRSRNVRLVRQTGAWNAFKECFEDLNDPSKV